MENKMKELDIPFIKNLIQEKHNIFLKETGNLSSKVSGDHQLVLSRLTSRIMRILQEFCHAGIIDSVVEMSSDKNIADSYYGFVLDQRYINGLIISKNGYVSKIIIWTDGKTIMFQSSGMPFIGIEDLKVAAMRKISVDDFDGKEFSEKLLNYIHQIIYFRKETYEQKLKEFLKR
jgi:hypothetical protein